jgi:adenylosuccinate synthase
MPVVTIVGAQWGDEGKGRVVDQLGARVDLLVHYSGGANLVQSMVADGEWLVFHLVPATALRHGSTCLLAQGMAIDPLLLLEELASLRSVRAMNGKLFVDERAHVVLPHHMMIDSLRAEPEGASGVPRRGVGPCYADKIARRGVQVGDLLRPEVLRTRIAESIEAAAPIVKALGGEVPSAGPIAEKYLAAGAQLEDSIVDGAKSVLGFVKEGRNVVLEALLGTMVDVDHGHYPFVVGASTVASAAPIGAGIPPQLVQKVVGVAKAYSTRAGQGPFPVELGGELAAHLASVGREVGASSASKRRCGMFGAPELRYAAQVNGFRAVALTKLDVLTGLQEIPFCVGYTLDGEVLQQPPFEGASRAQPLVEMLPGWSEAIDDCRSFDSLPKNAQRYVKMIEDTSGVRVASIGVGSDPEQTIVIEDILAV